MNANGETQYVPKCRLFFRHKSRKLSLLYLRYDEVNSKLILGVREIGARFWSAALALRDADGTQAMRIPTSYACRSMLNRQLGADFVEMLNCPASLHPTSFIESYNWLRQLAQRWRSEGKRPMGVGYAYGNLVPQMNLYAALAVFLELGMDVRLYHHQVSDWHFY